MFDVKNSLMDIVCLKPGYFWLMKVSLALNLWAYIKIKNITTEPTNWNKLYPFYRIKACINALLMVSLVNKKCINAMKAP